MVHNKSTKLLPRKFFPIKLISGLFTLMFIVSSCKPQKDVIRFQNTSMSYFEFVYEDASCSMDCSREHLVISNGITFTRTETALGSKKNVMISIGEIDAKNAALIIGEAEKITINHAAKDIICKDCRAYHLFYGDKGKTKSFSTLAYDAPDFIQRFEKTVQSALQNEKKLEPFFIHFIFEKTNKEAVDYHFYFDGTVIKEEFGPGNGDLISSAIYKINDFEIKKLRQLVTKGFYSSAENLENCRKNNIDWGYLEIKDKDDYGLVFTCGTGESEADKLFLDLLKKTGAQLK